MLYSWHRDWGASSRPFFLSTETGEALSQAALLAKLLGLAGNPASGIGPSGCIDSICSPALVCTVDIFRSLWSL